MGAREKSSRFGAGDLELSEKGDKAGRENEERDRCLSMLWLHVADLWAVYRTYLRRRPCASKVQKSMVRVSKNCGRKGGGGKRKISARAKRLYASG